MFVTLPNCPTLSPIVPVNPNVSKVLSLTQKRINLKILSFEGHVFCRQLSHSGIWPKQKEGEQLVHSDLAQTSSIKKKRAAGPPDLAQIASKKKGATGPKKI